MVCDKIKGEKPKLGSLDFNTKWSVTREVGGEQVLLKSARLPKVRLDLQGCKIDKISLQDNATQVSLQAKNMF